MDELLADFVAESRDMLETLAGEMVAWEGDPTDRARLDTIFRFFHTVKGNCGFFDFPRLEALSHAAEDVLSDVRAGRRAADAGLVDAVLAVIDRIAIMVNAIESGEEFPQDSDEGLIAALNGADPAGDEREQDAATETAPAQPAKEGTPGSKDGPRTIRLPVDLLDRVMSGVSDMVLTRNELARRMQDMGGETGLETTFGRLSMILDEVRDAMTRTRMQRIETLFSAFPRMVRDLSAELGKQVMVEIQGGDVELDREMIELIRDPLMHIIRNAVDHGIEKPADRLAGGKREIGLLAITARQAGNQIRIGISDDGRGIDCTRLVAKAIASGIVTAEDAAQMSPAEQLQLICEPGLSTAEQVTSLSGRGVGMDVVRANIERVGGTLQVFSQPGVDTRILLSLPLTLSIVPALTMEVRGQRFAVPRSYVEEVYQVPANDGVLVRGGGRTMVTLRDQRIACGDLGAAFGLGEKPIEPGSTLIVFRLMVGDPFALAVDKVLDHQELVVKPIAPAIMQTGLYVGTTLLDDGSPVLMLDVPGVAELADVVSSVEQGSMRQKAERPRGEAERPGHQVLLFAGLDGKRRAIGMSAVNRIEKAELAAVRLDGAGSQIVIGEQILPLVCADGGPLPADRLEYFRLNDGRTEIAFAIGQMLDTAVVEGDLTPATDRPDLAGIALVDGEPIEVVDVHYFFATYAREARAVRPPVCRLPDGDRWYQDFLRPLVEAAGYWVIGESDDGEADIAIASLAGGAPARDEPPLRAAAAIWLRDTREAHEVVDASIYRYDRDGLIQALRDAASGRA